MLYISGIIDGLPTGVTDTGLNFKLDVGLYRLDQQVACQRHRQHTINANAFTRVKNFVASAFAQPTLAFATVRG